MIITRIFNNAEGDTFFQDLEIELEDAGEIGKLSRKYNVKEIIFRETPGSYDYDFHNAPQKQFVITLDGEIEVETSLGDKRRFKAGDILLVEDTTGKGRSVDGKLRRSIFVTIGEDNASIK